MLRELSDCLGLLVVVPEGRDQAEDPLAFFCSSAGCLNSVFKSLRKGSRVRGGVLQEGHVRDASLLGAFNKCKRAVEAQEGLPKAEKGLRAIKTRVLLANRSNLSCCAFCYKPRKYRRS